MKTKEKTKEKTYKAFLRRKTAPLAPLGPVIDESTIHESAFPFQRAIIRWAVRKGRCAIFADTGLGKTRMQLEWARLIGGPTLIVCPLSVAAQTVAEADAIGVAAEISRDGTRRGDITVTNYEQAHKFQSREFTSVVLDESSILKSIDGKTKTRLTVQFSETKFRLCCSATPAPNDISEIANHAEFLGLMNRAQMLATFFVNNADKGTQGGWRLKGHAKEPFYKWMASWGMAVRLPSDIGFDDDGYILPGLDLAPEFVDVDIPPASGEMFYLGMKGIQDRSRVRRETLVPRVGRAASIVNGTDDQWIVWCGLNDESALLASSIQGSVEVTGSMDPDEKAQLLVAFARGDVRVLVTKPKIAGFGLNFQRCHRMVFVGLSDSFESYYQCIRRCYRFGQEHEVEARVVLSSAERQIWDNVRRKEDEASAMSAELVANISVHEIEELAVKKKKAKAYVEVEESGESFKIMRGDATTRLAEVETDSVGLSVFSPPFATLFSYSDSDRDLGNSKDYDQFFEHFAFVIKELLRVTKPGRNLCCHCAQLPRTKVYDGVMGCRDFRGDLIRAFESDGWIYHGEVCIDKCPQAQAIRTKAHGLMFVTKERDAAKLRMAYADYILIMKKPGENAEPVKSDVSNDEWIQWARPIWYGIKETETLQYRSARDQKDEKHICPLQLETIERCVRLWSNPGDLVLSPFAGIGSEGYIALQHGRKFVGIELKDSYWKQAVKNIRRAERESLSVDNDIVTMIESGAGS